MRVSFIIAIYNHSEFLEIALRTAMEQDYPDIEYIISDDCSTDGSFELVTNFIKPYLQSKDIKYHKNDVNLGVIENFKKNISLSTGEIIVGGAGDDFFHESRVSQIVKVFRLDGNCQAVFSNGFIVKNGVVVGPVFHFQPKFASNYFQLYSRPCFLHGATAAYRRELCLKFLSFPCTKNFQEDATLSFMACCYGGIKYIDRKLVYYRLHDSNVSNPNNFQSLKNLLLNKSNIAHSRMKILFKYKKVSFLYFLLIFTFCSGYLFIVMNRLGMMDLFVRIYMQFRKIKSL